MKSEYISQESLDMIRKVLYDFDFFGRQKETGDELMQEKVLPLLEKIYDEGRFNGANEAVALVSDLEFEKGYGKGYEEGYNSGYDNGYEDV